MPFAFISTCLFLPQIYMVGCVNILRRTVKVADDQCDLWTCAEIAFKDSKKPERSIKSVASIKPIASISLSTNTSSSGTITSQPVSFITHLYALPFVLSASTSVSSTNFPAWWKLAACAGYQSSRIMPEDPRDDPPTDIFFPERGEKEAVQAAKRICTTCPVRLPCLIDGLRESYGVFGGYTVIEREEIRRKVKSAVMVDTFQPPHRDQPGWCIDCGVENDFGGTCSEPGSRRHDPFFIFDRPRRETEERIATARRIMEEELWRGEEWR